MKRTRIAKPEKIPPWGVYVVESHHEVGFQMTSRRHPFLKILMMLDGAGCVHMGRQAVPCCAGDVLVVPIDRNNRVEDDPGQPISLYAVCVDPKTWQADPTLHRRLPGGRVPNAQAISARLSTVTRQLLFEQSDPRSTCAVRMVSGALEILALIADAFEVQKAESMRVLSPAETVQAYVQTLNRQFIDPGSLDDVSMGLGLSRRHFTQLFRKVTGQTWLQRVRDLRLNHAERLLKHTDRSIASIAFECGFGDLSSFYRAFKVRHADSPVAWRRTKA